MGGNNFVSDPSLQGLRVLVLDAGEGLGHMVFTVLRNLGIDDISISGSPGKALETLRGRNFALIIGHMKMSGFEAEPFARLLRGNTGAANAVTPLILITDQPQKSRLRGALDAGVTSFLTGTLTPERLRAQITSVIQLG